MKNLEEIKHRIFHKIVDFQHRPSLFARNVIITFVIQILILVMGVGYIAVLGRQLGAEGKGIVELTILVPTLMAMFLTGGVNIASVYYASSGQMNISQLTANSVSYTIMGTLLGIGVVFLLNITGLLTTLLPNIPVQYIILGMVGLPIELLSAHWRAILQGQNLIKVAGIINFIRILVLLILTILFLVVWSFSIVGALVAYLLAGIFHLLIFVKILYGHHAKFSPSWNRVIMLKTFKFGMKAHIGNVLQYYNYRLDVFLVNYFLGPTQVGIYNVSTRIAETLWFLPNAVGFVIMPKAASSKPEKMNAFTPYVFSITMGITVFGAIAIALVAKQVIYVIFGASFVIAYIPLLLLLPGAVVMGGAKILMNEIAGRGYPQYNSINAAIALVITITLNIIFIPKLGVPGAAISSTIAYSFSFLLAVFFYMRVRRHSLKDELKVGI